MPETRKRVFGNAHVLCAPFVVLRSAGLSTDTVRQYFDNRLAGPLASARAADAEMAVLAPLIEDGLHNSVKQLNVDKLRYQAIELRRSIHNRRAICAPKWIEVRDSVAALDPATGERLHRWSDAHSAFEVALQEMNSAETRLDSEAFARSLLLLWNDENFALGISHSNPSLFSIYDKIAAGKVKAGRRSRFVNTVLSYLVRSGTKTSPITTFMQCTMLPIDLRQPESAIDFQFARLVTISSLNRGVYADILDRAREADISEQLPLMINPSFRIEAGEAITWKATNQRREGRIWRSERLQRLRLGPTLVKAIEQTPSPNTFGDWRQRLTDGGVVADRADGGVQRLIEMGVLVRHGYEDPICVALARETADLLEQSAVPSGVATVLGEIERDANDFATLTARERVASARMIDERCAQLLSNLANDDKPTELSGLVIENSWWRDAQGHLGRDFDSVVQRALCTVANKLTVSAEYCWLRDLFLEKFGPGGRCYDTLAFLTQAAAAFPTEGAPRPPTFDPLGDLDLSGFIVPISFHLQIAAKGLSAMASADPVIVVNAVYPRGVWQLSRYTVFDDADALVTQSAHWLRVCAGEEEPVALVFGAAGVTLQNHGHLTKRMIDLTRPYSNADWLSGADIVVAHDPANGRLVCEDRAGQRLRPFYLGGALPALHFGPTYFLNVIGEPISLRPPPARMVLSQGTQTEMLRHQPRVTEGGCILLRATWWIKSRHLAAELGNADFGTVAFRLHEYFEREGIPLESFVFGQTQDMWRVYSGATERFRKPMWCDLRNAWSLRRLIRIMEAMDYIVVREALPGLDDAILQIKGHPHVSEFHIEAAFRLPPPPGQPLSTGSSA